MASAYVKRKKCEGGKGAGSYQIVVNKRVSVRRKKIPFFQNASVTTSRSCSIKAAILEMYELTFRSRL